MVYQRYNRAAWRRQLIVVKLALVGILLIFGTMPVRAVEDLLLSRMQGDWVGHGIIRVNPTSSPERVFCKIANRLVDDGSVLQQKGRCAVANNSGAVKGEIAAIGDGRYEGSLNTPQSAGSAKLAGHADDDTIVMSAEFIDRFSRKLTLSIISLIVGGEGSYRLVSDTLNLESGKHFQSSDILFEPNTN